MSPWCLLGYREVHLRLINFRSEMVFSATQAVVSKSILEEAENSSIDWWSIPEEELVIPRDMLGEVWVLQRCRCERANI